MTTSTTAIHKYKSIKTCFTEEYKNEKKITLKHKYSAPYRVVTSLPIGKNNPIFRVQHSKKAYNPQSYPQLLWILIKYEKINNLIKISGLSIREVSRDYRYEIFLGMKI